MAAYTPVLETTTPFPTMSPFLEHIHRRTKTLTRRVYIERPLENVAQFTKPQTLCFSLKTSRHEMKYISEKEKK